MALTDVIAINLKKRDHLLRDDRILKFAELHFGPYATADGTGNKAEWIMPYAGQIIEVLHGAETITAGMQSNVEVDGTDIWAAEKTCIAGVENLQPDAGFTEFSRGSKIRVDISNAGNAVVNGAITIVVAYYKYNKK